MVVRPVEGVNAEQKMITYKKNKKTNRVTYLAKS
jgi:hypothetical protein